MGEADPGGLPLPPIRLSLHHFDMLAEAIGAALHVAAPPRRPGPLGATWSSSGRTSILAACGHLTPAGRYRPGNHNAISRAADSGESEPCTMLWIEP